MIAKLAPELPPPAPRKPLHTRNTTFQGFQREDGLWEVEAEMRDTKPFDFELSEETILPAEDALHRMLIRVTFDTRLTVVDIASSMASFPHAMCVDADRHMKRMIGSSMAKGWRKAIEDNLGKIEGCTHMRELLFNMATVAFQTLSPVNIAKYRRLQEQGRLTQAPPHLGQCHTFDFSGQAVQQLYPMFYKPRSDPDAREGS